MMEREICARVCRLGGDQSISNEIEFNVGGLSATGKRNNRG